MNFNFDEKCIAAANAEFQAPWEIVGQTLCATFNPVFAPAAEMHLLICASDGGVEGIYPGGMTATLSLGTGRATEMFHCMARRATKRWYTYNKAPLKAPVDVSPTERITTELTSHLSEGFRSQVLKSVSGRACRELGATFGRWEDAGGMYFTNGGALADFSVGVALKDAAWRSSVRIEFSETCAPAPWSLVMHSCPVTYRGQLTAGRGPVAWESHTATLSDGLSSLCGILELGDSFFAAHMPTSAYP